MATYEFICNKCGHMEELMFSAKTYDIHTLKDKPCHADLCTGMYEQSFEKTKVAHSWKGGPPTQLGGG